MSDTQGMTGAPIPWANLDTDGRILRLAHEIESLRYQVESLRGLVETAVRGVENIYERLDDIEGHPALSIPAIVGHA